MFDIVSQFFNAIRELDAQWSTADGVRGAIWDELMHAGTAAIFLLAVLALIRQRRTEAKTFIVATLTASVLIDLDHVPGSLGLTFLQPSTNRPHTHSLTTILVIAALATLVSRWCQVVLLGVAFGVTAHLFRDMSTGGVLFWWPVDLSRVVCPYDYYLLVLAGMTGLGIVHLSGITRSWKL